MSVGVTLLILVIGVFLIISKLSSTQQPVRPTSTPPKKINLTTGEGFFFIDVETANKNPNSICAIAIATISNGVINSKCWFVKPPTDEFTFSNIHNITYNDVKDSATFDIVWKKYVLPLIGDRPIVAHYAHFDINAIFSTLDYYHVAYDNNHLVTNTCIIARHLLPQLPNHKLPTLANHFHLNLEHHNPLSDVTACSNLLNLFFNFYGPAKVMMYIRPALLFADKKLYNELFFDYDPEEDQ